MNDTPEESTPKKRRPRKVETAGSPTMAVPGEDPDHLLKIFCANMRKIRKSRGLSQSALADMAGLDRTYISSIERIQRNVGIGAVQRIASALGVDARDMFYPLVLEEAWRER